MCFTYQLFEFIEIDLAQVRSVFEDQARFEFRNEK